MHRFLGLFLILSLFLNSAFSQTWTRMQSWGLDLEAIEWVNDSIGFSVGENLIIRTKDGGITWEEASLQFEGKLLDVAFWNANLGVAVGENGWIYKTENSGDTWGLKSSNTDRTLSKLSFLNENKLIAIGKSGTIMRSLDQGESWSTIHSGTSLDLNDITAINQDTAYIAANQGQVLTTHDGGTTWTTLHTAVNQNLNGIAFSTPLIGYAVGTNGTVVKTIDGGENWISQNTGVTTTLNKVAISPLDIRLITIVGDSATAIRSTNSAATFGKANLGAGNIRDLSSLHYKPSSNNVYTVGADGYLIQSANAGASYKQILAGSRNQYSGADFKTDRVGYVIGDKGATVLTTNGGVSFISRPIPEEIDLIGFDFWNNGFGYVGAESGKIYRTGNSAKTWVPVHAPTSSAITGFFLFAPSVLYVTGTDGYISSSFDSGVTWADPKESNTNEDLRDLTFFDYQVGFAIGKKGEILWSNGGTVWENLPKLTEENLNGLAKVDSTTAIVVGDHGVILRGTDQAKNWEKIETEITENLNAVDFWDEFLGFISGDNGLTLQTKDGGKTWVKIPTGTSRNLTGISAGNPLIVYAAGDDGTILKYECTTPIDLGEISGANESCLSEQIYSIPDTGILGVEIVWRVDGGEIISGQGTHEITVNWNTSGRNGVYVSNQNFCGNSRTSFREVLVSTQPDRTKTIQGEGSVCLDQRYSYSYLAEEGVKYNWSATGGELISGQGDSKVEILWSNSGEQEITLVQTNSCGAVDAVKMAISVNTPPTQPAAISGQSQVALGETQYEIVGEADLNYLWEIINGGGRILSGQGSPKVTILWENEGDFELSVVAENECNRGEKRIISVNVNIITSVPEKENLILRIYPNPSSGRLSIEFGEGKWKQLSLVNSLGQEVKRIELNPKTTHLSLEDLPKGILILHFSSAKEVLTRKVLVK